MWLFLLYFANAGEPFGDIWQIEWQEGLPIKGLRRGMLFEPDITNQLTMQKSIPATEHLLSPFQTLIDKDFGRYSNHVNRVFLNCLLLDGNVLNHEKYAIAAAFHDIGIWTNQTFDYIDPSVLQAKIYLESVGKSEWADEISQMIIWHHKMTAYRGPFEETVEVFRKADWIDVSLGLLSFDAHKNEISNNRQQFPNLGFHLFLVEQASKNFLRHPLNPLPMFRR
jgi:hypothetical protein